MEPDQVCMHTCTEQNQGLRQKLEGLAEQRVSAYWQEGEQGNNDQEVHEQLRGKGQRPSLKRQIPVRLQADSQDARVKEETVGQAAVERDVLRNEVADDPREGDVDLHPAQLHATVPSQGFVAVESVGCSCNGGPELEHSAGAGRPSHIAQVWQGEPVSPYREVHGHFVDEHYGEARAEGEV
eukprot:CAMPEP_0113839122 /NCGR_PEP_ID=MMETSP0328-20130328/10909_1 /TAXON_ID=39455 /ORGANISM="Alexandrium minutum" /LENGTH=181 /DNA_ID=CAMNT_0000807711 /DNA_START=267 /DNA_END=812 /DNA_ORIENTATION=+ /assembly_acc=CAM_ASM_000350